MPRPAHHLALLILLCLGGAPAWAAHVHALDPGRYHIGDNAYTHTTDFAIVDSVSITGTHLEIQFRLSAPTAVSVRINRIWGVGGASRRVYSNIVYLDRSRVGRILPGDTGAWSSASRRLSAGLHRARIVSEGPGDRDDFVLEGISVATADRVDVTKVGETEIWTDIEGSGGMSALGASTADMDAWIRRAAETWEERQIEQRMEQHQMMLQAITEERGIASADDIPAREERDRGALNLSQIYQSPRESPQLTENREAIRLGSLRLEPSGELEAGGAAPTAVISCRVDQAFVVRASTPTLWWRWTEIGIDGEPQSVGGGPVVLSPVDQEGFIIRWPLPLAPPTPGRWRLEITVALGEFGATGQLRVTVR
ncbi:hypothetical protein JXA47_10735 [Candidatus Sumerlaeota bacterium]|nr:hypothetical protein [Candidatus Sumerlaeota bacterium]